MINLIKNWIYSKYRVNVPKKHIVMLIILFFSIILLIFALASRPKINQQPEPEFIPLYY